jgi:hypothetical protein
MLREAAIASASLAMGLRVLRSRSVAIALWLSLWIVTGLVRFIDREFIDNQFIDSQFIDTTVLSTPSLSTDRFIETQFIDS